MPGKLMIWKLPVLTRIVRDALRNPFVQHGDIDSSSHLIATFEWLKASQDRTGGVCEDYSLAHGWGRPSPSLTAMCVPTFLEVGQWVGSPRVEEHVRAMIDFIAAHQQMDGWFHSKTLSRESGMETQVKETATILRELLVANQLLNSDVLFQVCSRAAEWLFSAQKALSANVPLLIHAHLASSLAHFGCVASSKAYQNAAVVSADKLLEAAEDNTCWINHIEIPQAGVLTPSATVTALALTYRALYETGCLLEQEEYLRLAQCAIERLMRRFELKQDLPTAVNTRWSGLAPFSDLAGNTLLALLWLHVYKESGDARFLNAALKVLTFVGNTQALSSRPPFNGISESYPLWKGAFKVSTAATKFFADGLLQSEQYLKELDGNARRAHDHSVITGVPAVPAVGTTGINNGGANAHQPIKVAIMVGDTSTKFSPLVEKLINHGVHIDGVIIVLPEHHHLFHHLSDILAGKSRIWRKLFASTHHVAFDDAWYPGWSQLPTDDHVKRESRLPKEAVAEKKSRLPKEVAAEKGIPFWEVKGTNSAAAVGALKAIQPDLGILVGMGIIREPLLSVPRIGFLNAHTGLLPYYRGKDALAWTVLNGDPLGCSVHLIDNGVDTGEILASQLVEEPGDPQNLKKAVKELQVNLLCWATEYIIQHGELPPTTKQSSAGGRQYYLMHARLREYVERKYRDRVAASS
jgi:folate-dependent phosphoribosylglycinamide formyltransferase PurN